MKRMSLFMLLLVGLVFLPLGAFAEDEGIGEYVCEMAQNGQKPAIPNGHFGMIAKYADNFLNTGAGGHRTLYADSLVDGIDDAVAADELNDFLVLDIRLEADYCKGHIPGAVNIPFLTIAKPESLVKLPTDRPILVVCYTGHTASQTTTILNLLGFNAWTLRFGMTSWTASSAQKIWSAKVPQTINGAGYAMEKCTN